MFNFRILSNQFPSIVLDKSQRGRNLCQHPLQLIFSMLQIQMQPSLSLNPAFKLTTARLLEVFIQQKKEMQISYKKILISDFF